MSKRPSADARRIVQLRCHPELNPHRHVRKSRVGLPVIHDGVGSLLLVPELRRGRLSGHSAEMVLSGVIDDAAHEFLGSSACGRGCLSGSRRLKTRLLGKAAAAFEPRRTRR